jgi:thioredoxin reductase
MSDAHLRLLRRVAARRRQGIRRGAAMAPADMSGERTTSPDQLARLRVRGVPVVERPVVALDSANGRLRHVRLQDGETLDRDALFFYVGWRLRTDVARALGCELRDDGSIVVDAAQATSVDRVYAAGNCADPRALVPTAAGAGVAAAVAINARLTVEDADRAVAASAPPQSATQVR